MKLKFLTQGRASKYQHRLKDKIENKKYKLQKEEKLKKKKRKKTVHDNVGKKYYVILLPQTLVIFF